MGADDGHHRDRYGVRRGTRTDLPTTLLPLGTAGNAVRPDRLVGGDDTVRFRCIRPVRPGAGAPHRWSAVCDPVLGLCGRHPGSNSLDTGHLGLDAAPLSARLLRQPALRHQRNLADDDHTAATQGRHHGPLFGDRVQRLCHRPTVAPRGWHRGLAALYHRYRRLHFVRPDLACGRATTAGSISWRRDNISSQIFRIGATSVVCGFHGRRLRTDPAFPLGGIWRSTWRYREAHRFARHLLHNRQCRAADFSRARGRQGGLGANHVDLRSCVTGRLPRSAGSLRFMAYLAARFRPGRSFVRDLHPFADPA